MAGRLLTKDYAHFSVIDEDGETLATIDGAPNVDRALPGDSVTLCDDGKCELLRRTEHPVLVGTLDLPAKTRHGFTPRGVPLYLFFPYDEAYPPMLVASTERDTTTARVALATFERWDVADKYPRGALVRILGVSGDAAVELDALYWQYAPWAGGHRSAKADRLPPPAFGRQPATSPPAGARQAPCPPSPLLSEDRFVIDWPTCNIDPPGCRDVDDVISARQTSAKTWECAISIADVAAVVSEGGADDVRARRCGQSLYQDGRPPCHMLPTALAEGVASLLPGPVPRPAVSFMFCWCPDTDAITDVVWRETNVINRASVTYDELLTATEVAGIPVTVMRGVAHALRVTYDGLGPDVDEADPHGWVEAYMVWYNREAARRLHAAHTGVLRRHAAEAVDAFVISFACGEAPATTLVAATYCTSDAPDIVHHVGGLRPPQPPCPEFCGDATGETKSNITAAATYCTADAPDIVHHGLKQAIYCHASSPLRRYADLVNQRLLKTLIRNAGTAHTVRLRGLAADLNRLQKRAKAHDRDMTFIRALNGQTVGHVECVVVQVTEEKTRVHVPAWRRIVSVKGKERRDEGGAEVRAGASAVLHFFVDMRQRNWKRRMVTKLSSAEFPTTS